MPVKVGPLTDRGILAPIVYADLTEADEGEAQRRLLERVKKALDASYRPKPLTRPGFPGSPAREVPSKPRFPPVESNSRPDNPGPHTHDGGSAGKTTGKIKVAILGLVAACAIVLVGLWASGRFSTPSNVTARDGSVGVGGGMFGSKIIIQGPRPEPGPPNQQPKQ